MIGNFIVVDNDLNLETVPDGYFEVEIIDEDVDVGGVLRDIGVVTETGGLVVLISEYARGCDTVDHHRALSSYTRDS